MVLFPSMIYSMIPPLPQKRPKSNNGWEVLKILRITKKEALQFFLDFTSLTTCRPHPFSERAVFFVPKNTPCFETNINFRFSWFFFFCDQTISINPTIYSSHKRCAMFSQFTNVHHFPALKNLIHVSKKSSIPSGTSAHVNSHPIVSLPSTLTCEQLLRDVMVKAHSCSVSYSILAREAAFKHWSILELTWSSTSFH